MIATKLWALDELVKEFGWNVPYEVVDGELREVSPCSSDPGRVSGLISSPLGTFNEEHELGEIFVSDAGFVLSRRPLILVAPDIAFVRAENIPADYDFQSFFPGAPDLAVEVQSPTDRLGELTEKVERYLRAGTKIVWRVDPILRLVVVHRPTESPRALYLGDVLDGEEILPGFRLPVERIFREPRRGSPDKRRGE